MKVHKEGFLWLVYSFSFALIITFLTITYIPYFWVDVTLTTLAWLLFVFMFWFFRYPNRAWNQQDDKIMSPADGKVVIVEKIEESEFLQKTCKKISIFMSPLDVHANWYPVSGKVIYTKYHKGKYLVAWHPKASEKNERHTVVINNEKGNILVRQIAGIVARKIVPYAKKKDKVKQGEQLGFIKFGSRADVFLPISANILVNVGDKVKGRQTLLAEW